MSKEYIRAEYEKGTPVADIAAVLNITKKAVINRAGRDPQCPVHGSLLHSGIIGTDTSSLKGESIMSREPTQAELNAFKVHCEANGLPFDNWRAFWHKTKEYSSLFANKAAEQEVIDNQEIFLKRLQKAAPRIRKSPVPSKTLAIPANFDVHIGKHCELIRTGNDYTPDMAVKQVLEGQAALFALTKPFGVSDILLPMGNDIIHVDNNSNTTTSGTPQDAYGSVESMMMLASEMYIKSIEGFAKNHNVWLAHVHSNHDRVAGWSVSQNVAAYFRNHPRVHVHPSSIDQRPFKYFLFGNDLIVFTHGEAKSEEILGTIQEEISLIGKPITRIYVYIAHKHHKDRSVRGSKLVKNKEKDYNGLITIKHGAPVEGKVHVEMVRSPSPADPWHALKGFHNVPAVEMYLHFENSNTGRFTHYF
jgi:hypothetical protein